MSITKREVEQIITFAGKMIMSKNELPVGVSRIQAFLALRPILKSRLYWYALSNAYRHSENLFQYRHDIIKAFSSTEPEREYLMNNKEKMFLQNLPEKITVYRGMTVDELKSKRFGVSWTLKKSRAEFFAYTYGSNQDTSHLKKVVHKLTIDKSDVIAYFGEREDEIIYIQPETLKNCKYLETSRVREIYQVPFNKKRNKKQLGPTASEIGNS